MNSLKSLIIMMSMYTRIPMPRIEWEEPLLKKVLLFLPAAGIPAGLLEGFLLVLFILTGRTELTLLYAAAACGIPAAVTGGIHMDGLADSADALASWGSPEKKREILHDPHIGTFGVLSLLLYFLFQAALLYSYAALALAGHAGALPMGKPALLLASVYILSRALTQIAIAWIPPSGEGGMLYRFSSVVSRRALGGIGLAVLAAGQVLWCLTAGPAGLCLLPVLALHLVWFRRKMIRHFGGLSGDLCGRLIQLSELEMTALLCILSAAGLIG